MELLKLKLPAAIVAGIVSAAAAGGGAWAVASERLEESRARIDKLERKTDASEQEHQDQRLRVQKLEDALVNVGDMVKEIHSDVKELKRR